jgi:hypothetical protein
MRGSAHSVTVATSGSPLLDGEVIDTIKMRITCGECQSISTYGCGNPDIILRDHVAFSAQCFFDFTIEQGNCGIDRQ